MKNALCWISLLLILSCTSTKEINTTHQNPQPSTQQTDAGILGIDDVFSGKHRANFFDGITWRRNGHHFTRIEQGENGNEIIQYDAQTAEKEILISSSQLIPPGQTRPLNVEGYEWSDHEELVLLYTNSKRVWRENTRGDYWIFNMSSETLRQIGKDLPASSLMLPNFLRMGILSGMFLVTMFM